MLCADAIDKLNGVCLNKKKSEFLMVLFGSVDDTIHFKLSHGKQLNSCLKLGMVSITD